MIGGGFVGLSCALHLQRSGLRVVLLDRAVIGSASAASHGNAGSFAAYANVRVNRLGLWRELPRLLLDADSLLSIRATPHLLRMMP